MANWNPTPSQQNAIDARGKNILVSAAAGSGKTAVLVERVVKMITDDTLDIDVDELLIVTFTNAAAAEMKNRISTALTNLIKENSNNTNAQKQLALLPNASICTIDSFCLNLVRENFFDLDISQDFKILDESESVLIKQNAINEIIDDLYVDNKDEFKSLVELLSSTSSDTNLAETVKRINDFIMSQPFPFVWLNDICEMYNPDVSLDDSELKAYIYSKIKDATEYCRNVINSSLEAICPDDNAYLELNDIVNADKKIFDNIDDYMKNRTWDDLYYYLSNVSFDTMTRKKSDAKISVSANRNIYRGAKKDGVFYKDILPLVSVTSEDYSKDCEYLYPIVKLLCKIVEQFNEKMFEIKKEMNAYSFSDIEHFAIDLLFKCENGIITRTKLADDYQNNFKEILVDEYQDTNTAQDTLFRMLSNGRNRFMVGDVKQSIYRFRLAMPQIFNDKKNSYSMYSDDNTDTRQKIILDKNFRSRKGICDYTNFVFSNIMTEQIGEMVYDENEYLNYGSDYKPTDIPSAQIKLVETPSDADKVEYEAMQVAKHIKEKVANKEQIRDGKIYRDITYGDFAILFRSTKSVMPVYARVLAEYDIPVASGNKVNLFENNEVAILMSLLRVIDNPMQDIPLLATLMSVFYGYDSDTISLARINTPRGNLYSAICADKEHFSAFLNDLDRYRKYASSMSVESFLRQLIYETSYLSIVSAMGNAEQRKLNVLKLIDIAKSYDNGESVGLTAFVRYVDSVIKSKQNVESAEITHAGEDSVLLMSVHKSKGLEFPVCILANAGHKYNFADLTNQVLLHNKYGIGLKVHNEEGLYRYNSLLYSTISDMNRSAIMSENLRVLYVAITRAKEQFISIISNDNFENHLMKLGDKVFNNSISPLTAKHISNDGDFILLTALLHKDAGCLRSYCSNDIIPQISEFDLDISFLDYDSDTEDKAELIIPADDSIVDAISKKLEFKYSRLDLAGLISKRNASSLDEIDAGYEYLTSSKPAFLNTGGLTPAQKGTAMHTFMQYCDYNKARASLDDEIARVVAESHLSKEMANSLDKERLNTLFNSSFADDMFSADRIYKEIKISSFVPVRELEDVDFDDDVFVQGIADCVFEKNGELYLVDYKTDRVNNEDDLLNRYKKQISFYKKAIEKTFNKPVKYAMLYSFHMNKCCIYK